MSRAATKGVRCAVYTRKSTEEGLDQAYNSLHAQRDACEAYVRSQAGEGWVLSPERYDDGGYSGGTMERPALKRLLDDVQAGRINVVVVYKIDRLTRSLPDFARIVERLDKAEASFVSVTQSFNTTSSMGRLTLNVLLSFAQFEREVTGERIRDKIAASKARGMWMGGNLPLGYDRPIDPETRMLVVNEDEAQIVRRIFSLYLELGSISRLQRRLEADGVRSKRRVSANGAVRGDAAFSRGALIHLLRNRIYLGELLHKRETVAVAHPAIVDREMFDAVQQRLATQVRVRSPRSMRSADPKLTGRIFDSRGRPMTPVFSYGRNGRVYRYYVSAPLQQGARAADDETLLRVPGDLIEDVVIDAVGRANTFDGLNAVVRVEIQLSEVHVLLDANRTSGRSGDARSRLERLTASLFDGERALLDPDHEGCIRMVVPACIRTRGGRTWIEDPGGGSLSRRPKPDRVLAEGLMQAHAVARALGVMSANRGASKAEMRGASDSYTRSLVRLAFLAPDIQGAILAGRQPPGLRLERLLKSEIPLEWSDQRRSFGFAPAP